MKGTIPAYDDMFSPPAPVVRANLRNPQSDAIVHDVLLLIDSGADVTLLPSAAIESVGLERSAAAYELIGFDGTRSTTDEVRAELAVFGRVFQGWFLLTDDTMGILGRDIMNRVALLLDRPRLTWELSVAREG